MAGLDALPADQRAALQLVLQRGRSYDEIAKMLSIDRAAVRQRALAGLDALGPQTGVSAQQRALITDYLLGQLPPRVSDEVRTRLAESAGDRAWARVVSSELAPLATGPLPEIPVEATMQPDREPRERAPRRPRSEPGAAPVTAAAAAARAERPTRPSSRRGGALLLAVGGLATIAIVIVVLVLLLTGGSSSHNSTQTTSSRSATTTTPTTGTSSTATKVIGQINLSSPTGSKSTTGIAEILRQGSLSGIAILAQGVPPNTKHDAYAVWLYSPPASSRLLGFVNPGVGNDGRLSTQGQLPSNASQYKELLVTLETQGRPTKPGKIVLQGALNGL